MSRVKAFKISAGVANLVFAFQLLAGTASADGLFDVVITGEVEFNQVQDGFLGQVMAGDMAELSFQIDANNFVDSTNFPTRGYVINETSFSLSFNGAAIGLQNPFPGGEIPYFVLRDNDPAVDGFFVSTNVDNPFGVPIDQEGAFGQFLNSFMVTYGGDTLPSLNIEDATGVYDFDGLTVFNWTIDDGPFNPTGMIFNELTISQAIPEPSSAFLICITVAAVSVRRKRG